MLETLEPARDVLEPLAAVTRVAAAAGPDSWRGLWRVSVRGASPERFPDTAAEQIQRGLDALLIGADAAVTTWPDGLWPAVADRSPASPAVRAIVIGGAGQLPTARRRAILERAAEDHDAVLLCEWLWPLAPGRPTGVPLRLRRRNWWVREADRAGMYVAAEVRSIEAGPSVLALRPGAPRARPAGDVRVLSEPLAVHLDDDLSLGNSFSWISAALALALRDRGLTVSIEPSAVSPVMSRERDDLRRLMRPRTPSVRCSLGWTHYWRQYQRELTGAATLALFAVNYTFTEGTGPSDDWIRAIVAGDGGIAPISGFCRDVLLDAGVASSRLHVIPMGCTARGWDGEVPPLPGASGLRILHVTNAGDLERHGTEQALAAFRALCERGHHATLVIRDYGAGSVSLRDAVARERAAGRDVRLWPVFFDADEMMRTMAGFDLLLAPFRGEGFGIKILDAMASGLAVVAPLFGGPRDYLDESVAFVVAHELEPMSSGYDAARLRFDRRPSWARPDQRSLVAALERAASDRGGLAARQRAARVRASTFTWASSAERVEHALRELLRGR